MIKELRTEIKERCFEHKGHLVFGFELPDSPMSNEFFEKALKDVRGNATMLKNHIMWRTAVTSGVALLNYAEMQYDGTKQISVTK